MPEQPSGTVTLLFTDIEASTRLLQQVGTDTYSELLDAHRALLRAACARHGGYEVNYEGDSFFVAFQAADDAAAAAVDAQQALGAESWPKGVDLRVRMGLHTGEPRAVPPKYVGLDVHVAARIMAAAHGGQIVASERTVGALGGQHPVLDLGERRLREISEPIRVYQLGYGTFPPLAAPFAATLPVPLTSLIGRRRELDRLATGIDGGARLLTITGPGGVGKTRLALAAAAAAADAFRGGVWFVSLERVASAELIEELIASAVGASSSLAARLGVDPTLLVLDNLEHLDVAAEVVERLLTNAPTLQVVATSRRRLGLRAEVECILEPLGLQDGVTLFVERAGRGEPNADVERLVARLDGLPLAIELAAARAKLLSPREILGLLSTGADPLTGSWADLPPRQRTLRDTIGWSYDLLPCDAQTAFAKLAVFDGGFRVDEAGRVADATLDDLAVLVDHSLLRPAAGDGRFAMLQTIRDYAVELLDARPDAVDVRTRHAAWVIDLVGAGQTALESQPTEDAYFATLESREADLRAALDFLADTRPIVCAELVSSLFGYWHRRGLRREGYRWSLRAIELSEPRVDLLSAASFFASRGAAHESAATHARDQLALARRLGDRLGETNALRMLGLAVVWEDDFDEAERCYERGRELAVEYGFVDEEWLCVANIADIALLRGDWSRVVELIEPMIEALGRRGWTESFIINTYNLALAELRIGRCERARERAVSLLAETSRLEFEEMRALALFATAAVALDGDDVAAAARLASAAAAAFESVEQWLPHLEQELVERALAAAELQFGGGRARTLEQEGRGLSRLAAHAIARSALSAD